MRRRALRVGAVVAGIVAGGLAPRAAEAALTSSELGEIRSHVAEGRAATAGRVRALVARPDLTADESADALRAAFAPVPFNDARAAYAHELLYGPQSQTSRGVVAVAVTRALLARADALMPRATAGAPDTGAIAELVRLYGAIDADVANAGTPHGAGHDPAAGIPDGGYDAASRAIKDHVAHWPKALRGDQWVPTAFAPARAQLEIALVDMMNDAPTRNVDAADILGLAGAERASLVDAGVLVLDDGTAPPAPRLETVRVMLTVLRGAWPEVEAVALVPMTSAVHGRRAILAAPDRDASAQDAGTELATMAVKRAFVLRPDLHDQAARDLGGDPTGEVVVQAVALARDAQAALDAAMGFALAGKPKNLAALSDAMGALAAFAPASAGGMSLALGGPQAHGTIRATDVRLAPAGYVTSFTLGTTPPHKWTLARDAAGTASAKRDGAPVTSADVDMSVLPLTLGVTWTAPGLVFAKMAGAPRAAVAAGGRVRLQGTSAKGVDAIAMGAPGDDAAVDADVTPNGNAAIALRAISTPAGLKGIALVLDADATPAPRASIRAWDEAGHTTELAHGTLPAGTHFPVHVAAKGGAFDAKVGALALHATIPAGLEHGDVALVVNRGGSLDATGFAVKKP
jgi:hypothetical protein